MIVREDLMPQAAQATVAPPVPEISPSAARSFADVLAGYAAAQRPEGTPVALEVAAPVALPTGDRAVQRDADQPGAPPDPAIAPASWSTEAQDHVSAERFNENGFFAEARADAGAIDTACRPVSPVDGSAPDSLPIPMLDDALAGERGAQVVRNRALTPATVELPAQLPAVPVPARRIDAAVLPALALPASASPVELQNDATEGRTLAPARRTSAMQTPTAVFASLAIALHEVAGGLRVVARISGLSDAEKARLSDEIARMLAAHGLSATDIRIAAPIAAFSQPRGYP